MPASKVMLASDVLMIIEAMLTILVVKDIDTRQEKKSKRLSTVNAA